MWVSSLRCSFGRAGQCCLWIAGDGFHGLAHSADHIIVALADFVGVGEVTKVHDDDQATVAADEDGVGGLFEYGEFGIGVDEAIAQHGTVATYLAGAVRANPVQIAIA